MSTMATTVLTAAAAFLVGIAATVLAVVAGGALFLSQGGLAFGGALDPISAGLAVGLGGLALSKLRGSPVEVPA